MTLMVKMDADDTYQEETQDLTLQIVKNGVKLTDGF